MGCFTKFFLFILNFIVFVIGVGVVVLASLVLSHGNEFQSMLSEGTFTVPIILLIMGLVVMVIGFFGCFGALRESPCLLYTYATIVLLLFIAQVAVAVYGIMKKDDLTKFVSDNMVNVFEKYGGEDTELTTSLDVSQHNMKCCGVHNYTDWFDSTIKGAYIPNGGDVPIGCCRENVTNCNVGIEAKPIQDVQTLIFTEGCFTQLVDAVEGEAMWLIIGSIVLGLVQLACVIIACGIGKNSASQHSTY